MLKLFENRFINFENRFINTMEKLAIYFEEEGAIDVKPGRGGEFDAVAAVEKTGEGGGRAGHTRAGARQRDTTALSSACTISVARVTSCHATNSCPTSVAKELSLPGEAGQGPFTDRSLDTLLRALEEEEEEEDVILRRQP